MTMGKKIWPRAAALILCACMVFTDFTLTVKAEGGYDREKNQNDTLHVPSQINKIGDTYYLVDCYHDQILYNSTYRGDASGWKVMTRNVKQPHAIDGDGVVNLVVDTENNRVLNYIKTENGYIEFQVFDNIGIRPHYIVYDAKTNYFYVWSSATGQMYLFRRKKDSLEVYLDKIKAIPELYGKYVRSFTIDGNEIYFPCVEDSSIYVADKKSFKLKGIYPVPAKMAGMVQIIRIEDYFYVTVSTDIHYDQSYATFVRARTLEDFGMGNYEDVNNFFGGGGAPYYISNFDNSYFAVFIRSGGRDGVYKFEVKNDKICNVEEVCH